MAKSTKQARAPRLKVYETRIGFFDLAVAAPSMKAALAAFGTHANLFAEGAARETNDPDAVRLAMKTPGVAVRRAIGGTEIAKALSDTPIARGRARARKPAAKPAPDRSKLDAAERAIAEFEADAKRQAEEIAAERDALEARERQLRNGQDSRRRRLLKLRDEAREAYERAKRG